MSFKGVQKKIAAQGHSMKSAGAILAAASRNASPAAKRVNPKLKRVKGKMHGGGIVPEDGAYEMKKGEQVIPAAGGNENNYHGSEHYAHDLDRMKVPPSADARKAVETSSAPVNHGNVQDAFPLVDAGCDSGVGHWEGDCSDIKFVK